MQEMVTHLVTFGLVHRIETTKIDLKHPAIDAQSERLCYHYLKGTKTKMCKTCTIMPGLQYHSFYL